MKWLLIPVILLGTATCAQTSRPTVFDQIDQMRRQSEIDRQRQAELDRWQARANRIEAQKSVDEWVKEARKLVEDWNEWVKTAPNQNTFDLAWAKRWSELKRQEKRTHDKFKTLSKRMALIGYK